MGIMSSVFLSGDPKSDALLADDPFALLMGMLLDQQIGNPQHLRTIQPFPTRELRCAP